MVNGVNVGRAGSDQLRGVDKRGEARKKQRWRRRMVCLLGGAEENPEFGAQVSSAVLRYFYRQTRRFNRDSRYFAFARNV